MTIEAAGHVYDFDSALGVGQALADAAGGTPAHLVRADGTSVSVHRTAPSFPLSVPPAGVAARQGALRWRRLTGQSGAEATVAGGWGETVEVLGALEDAARGQVAHLVRGDGLSVELRSDNVAVHADAGEAEGTLGQLSELRDRIAQVEPDPERRKLYARSLSLSHYRDGHDGRLPGLADHVAQQRAMVAFSGLDEAGIQRAAQEELDADGRALAAFPLPEPAA